MNPLKLIKRLFIILGIVLVSIIVVINIPIISINHQASNTDYSNWMSETLSDNQTIITVKMLGAHDAFSKDIKLLSQPDIKAPSIMTGASGFFIKGYSVKQSVTQTADATELLESGVRYLDVRLSLIDDEWVTKHNFVSSDFLMILEDIQTFLDENTGEFLILDFQHIDGIDYDDDNDYQLFLNMLDTSGILNYHYTSDILPLHLLTYGDVTDSGTTSSVIIIDKFTKTDKNTLHYDTSIRSSWANTDSFDVVLEFLEDEKTLVETTTDGKQFVVMQAVTTMRMNPRGIIDSLLKWSLVERAEKFNNYLIEYESFDNLLDAMPIVMVDYANCGPFNDEIMTVIIDSNTN